MPNLLIEEMAMRMDVVKLEGAVPLDRPVEDDSTAMRGLLFGLAISGPLWLGILTLAYAGFAG